MERNSKGELIHYPDIVHLLTMVPYSNHVSNQMIIKIKTLLKIQNYIKKVHWINSSTVILNSSIKNKSFKNISIFDMPKWISIITKMGKHEYYHWLESLTARK